MKVDAGGDGVRPAGQPPCTDDIIDMAMFFRDQNKVDKLSEADAKKKGCSIPKQFKLAFKDKKPEIDLIPSGKLSTSEAAKENARGVSPMKKRPITAAVAKKDATSSAVKPQAAQGLPDSSDIVEMALYHRSKVDKLNDLDAKRKGCPVPKQFKLTFKDKKELEIDLMPKDQLLAVNK